MLDYFQYPQEARISILLKTLKLHGEAIDQNISQETFHQFPTRVKETIMSYPLET